MSKRHLSNMRAAKMLFHKVLRCLLVQACLVDHPNQIVLRL